MLFWKWHYRADFDLPGSSQSEPDRKQWSSSDLRGRWLAVYFIRVSRRITRSSGASKAFNDFFRPVRVIGISADSVDDHESFCEAKD